PSACRACARAPPAVFRFLVESGPTGRPAGESAARPGLIPSSLTFHLQHLMRAGVLTQRRMGRQLIYAADFATMNALVRYLTESCCKGVGSCDSVAAPESPTGRRKVAQAARARGAS